MLQRPHEDLQVFQLLSANAEATSEGVEREFTGLFDASIHWRSADAAWDVSIRAKNLNDAEYRAHTIGSRIIGTVDIWAPPRTNGYPTPDSSRVAAKRLFL